MFTIMGTVFKTREGHIFSCVITFKLESSGNSFAVDASDENNIICRPLKELATLANDEFDFITRYFDGYDQSDDVAALDDLDCLIHNECDEEKLSRLTAFYGSDVKEWERLHDCLQRNLFENAIRDYRNKES